MRNPFSKFWKKKKGPGPDFPTSEQVKQIWERVQSDAARGIRTVPYVEPVPKKTYSEELEERLDALGAKLSGH